MSGPKCACVRARACVCIVQDYGSSVVIIVW
jgi:hypothetical protein